MPTQQSPRAFELPTRLPLITELQNRAEALTKDARIVNAMITHDKVKNEYWIEKRPGYGTVGVKPFGLGYGVFQYSDDNGLSYFTVIGNKFYLDNPGLSTHTSSTLTASSGGSYHFDVVANVALATHYWVMTNGDKFYYGTSSLSLPTLVTDVNFPANITKGVSILNGTTYVMTQSGAIYGSAAPNDPRTWDPANVIQANEESDGGVFIDKQLNYIVAIKQWTTQFFYDAGNAVGSLLAKVPGSTIPYGCLSADTVQDIDGDILWVTYNKSVSPQVLKLVNLQPKIISTPEVERLLIGAVNLGISITWHSFSFKYSGHRFYGVTCREAHFTLVYDIDLDMWFPWTDSTGTSYWPIVGGYLGIFQDETLGLTYALGPPDTTPNDSGAIFPVDIYTPNYDAGVDRKKMLSRMRFVADQTPGSILQVRHSEDDYQTWSNFRLVDLSKRVPTLDDCGTFRRRAYHFRHYANTPFRIKAVDLQMALGTI
jgi:hypothetical protein